MRKNLVDAGDGFVGCMALARFDLRNMLSAAVLRSKINDLGYIVYMHSSLDWRLIDSFSSSSLPRVIQRQLLDLR